MKWRVRLGEGKGRERAGDEKRKEEIEKGRVGAPISDQTLKYSRSSHKT